MNTTGKTSIGNNSESVTIDLREILEACDDMFVRTADDKVVPLFQDVSQHVRSKRRKYLRGALGLTKLQMKVWVLMGEGLKLESIADELALTADTVKSRISELKDVLGSRKLNVICTLAGKFGIVSPDKLRSSAC